MTAKDPAVDYLEAADRTFAASEKLLEKIVDSARRMTEAGRDIDDYQVLTRKIAGLATRVEAARRLLDYTRACREAQGEIGPVVNLAVQLFIGEVARGVRYEAEFSFEDFGLHENDLDETLDRPELRAEMRRGLREAYYRALGRYLLERGAENDRWIPTDGAGDEERELRAMTRRFAREVVAPRAEEIHRRDLLVPEEFISQMAELGYFGMSIPEDYGGIGMSNLMMILATEELSAASLSAAGSLITRPEILAKALLKGGTEEQKRAWLPRVASGELMVAVAVTEPNVGSDVASLACRAEPATVGGREGWAITGAKAWCTFAGRADILSLLARSEPDPRLGHRGLSLFIVEKEAVTGQAFEAEQPGGGRLTGKADPTPGYRGMHSFTLQFDRWFVPGENLVGGEEGRGRGFYLQMDGFAAGRLQTAGRAVGLAQASLEAAARYAVERPQFGRPIAEFQNTQYEIGAMAVQVEAARQLTYAAARAMDAGESDAALRAAMAKLFACRAAVNVSQRAQVLHGGWGYAEEYAISRYVVDALVLPIFEGVEPILEIKVIGRGLLAEK